MNIKYILKYFVYLFIVFYITITITIFVLNTFRVKEGFDILDYIYEKPEERRSRFYTEAEAGAVDFGLTIAIAAINVTIAVLGVTLAIQLAIPIVGWAMAGGTIAAIAAAVANTVILAGKWVKANDPKTENDANMEINAIQTEVDYCELQIAKMDLSFNVLKYKFKGNQIHIKHEAKKILKEVDETTELIQELYFNQIHDPSSNIPMVQFYNECKNAHIQLLLISDEHTLRKDLDIKSSDIDLTLLDYSCIRYYISESSGENIYPPKKGDFKADITDYIIIVTYRVGKSIAKIKEYVNQQIHDHPDSKKNRKKHSISENNRKKMSHLFKKMKPKLDKIYEHIQIMEETIKDNAYLFEERDRLRAIINKDKDLIEDLRKYIKPHFHVSISF